MLQDMQFGRALYLPPVPEYLDPQLREHLREMQAALIKAHRGIFDTLMHFNRVGVGTTTPSENADMTLFNGVLCLKETDTPTADTNYGKVYAKDDNKLYFQDGAGDEHEIAFT